MSSPSSSGNPMASGPSSLAEDLGNPSALPTPLPPLTADGTFDSQGDSGPDSVRSVNITGSSGGGLLSNDQANGFFYSQYLIDSYYRTHMGILQMPVAGPPGTPCEIIQVHGGSSRRIIQWTCERMGAQPILPHWDTGNPNEVLQHKEISPASTIPMPGGAVEVWRVSGVYTYALKTPIGDSYTHFCGNIPVKVGTTQSIDGSLFSRDILRSS